MQDEGIAKQLARWTALIVLFLLPLTPLVVVNGFFFPFISGKAFYLRTLIEILVGSWAVLALMDREYRPRFSWLGVVVTAFVAWMFVADLFALNVTKAFWSNFERMEGWVLLIHLLGFFIAGGAVLRVERKWRAWFLTSIGVAVVISLHAILQLSGSAAIHQGSTRIDASLGNSAYLAIYLLFTVFVALWLALTEQYAWLKWSLIAFAAVEAILIFFTETRGTIIGLALGFGLALLLTALTAGKRVRSYAISGFLGLLILIAGFYLVRDSSFVQNNHILQRVASISLHDGQIRFAIWGMALKGAQERPLFGWGQEGFNYVFNKYFDPNLHAQEPWFDRAHNAFIDWLSAGGVPAFLLYISLFGTAIALLWRSSELSRPERIALTGALVGYAIHNIFVFDNLYSYIYFFAILSLIDSQVGRPMAFMEQAPELTEGESITYALPVAAVVTCVLIWYVNITGMNTSATLISALSAGDPAKSIPVFEKLVSHPNFAIQEIREQIVSYAAIAVPNANVPDAQKQQIATLAIEEMKKQVQAYPLDAREYMELSYAYHVVGDLENALKALSRAAELSPTKQEILIEKGTLEWNMNDTKAAQQDFTKAYELGPQFDDLAAYAAAGNIAAGDTATGNKILMDTFGTTTVAQDVLSVAYYHIKDWKRLVSFWQLKASSPDAPAESWLSFAAAYYASGDTASAIRVLNMVITKFPDKADQARTLLKQVQ